MAKYEIRMRMIRSGQSVPDEDSYDPLADMRAHVSSLKVSVFRLAFLGCAELSERVQRSQRVIPQ